MGVVCATLPSTDHTQQLIMGWLKSLTLVFALTGVLCQDEDDEKFKELCKDKSAGELFRLKAGKDNCRDVIQCTAAGLQAIRCPPGLAFDLEKQTCDSVYCSGSASYQMSSRFGFRSREADL